MSIENFARLLVSMHGFDHETSSPRHPQGNGLAERTVQTLKSLLKKSSYSGSDFQLALLALRTSPSESTGVSPAQLLMGRRLRCRLPAIPRLLASEVVDSSSVRRKDQQSKAGQASYYNRRHGTKHLSQLVPGEQLLVWDLERRTWRIPAKLVNRLSTRSYVVQLENGRTLRRNRHQLQARPDGVTEISLEEEDDEVFDENRFREKEGDVDRMDREEEEVPVVNGEINENGPEEQEEDPAEGTQEVEVEAEEQRRGAVTATRSGRIIKAPTWRKDYV